MGLLSVALRVPVGFGVMVVSSRFRCQWTRYNIGPIIGREYKRKWMGCSARSVKFPIPTRPPNAEGGVFKPALTPSGVSPCGISSQEYVMWCLFVLCALSNVNVQDDPCLVTRAWIPCSWFPAMYLAHWSRTRFDFCHIVMCSVIWCEDVLNCFKNCYHDFIKFIMLYHRHKSLICKIVCIAI